MKDLVGIGESLGTGVVGVAGAVGVVGVLEVVQGWVSAIEWGFAETGSQLSRRRPCPRLQRAAGWTVGRGTRSQLPERGTRGDLLARVERGQGSTRAGPVQQRPGS